MDVGDDPYQLPRVATASGNDSYRRGIHAFSLYREAVEICVNANGLVTLSQHYFFPEMGSERL